MAPTANFTETTLNGAISDSATTITLSSTTGLQTPGYVVIDRTDANGTATPNAREVVSYTGISGNDLTGCTRGADNSTARSHSSGAKVETMPTVGLFNSLATIVGSGLDNNGYLRAIASPASIARGEITQFVTPSIASIAQAHISRVINTNATVTGSLNVAGASVVGMPAVVVWEVKSTLSGATAILRTPLPIHRTGQWKYANFITRTVASGVSAIVDFNKNGTSIFDTIGRPMIAAGGTFNSTASIATKGFTQGDRFTLDYDGTSGTITDIIAMLVGE